MFVAFRSEADIVMAVFSIRVKKNVILSEPEASEGSKWPLWKALRNGSVILHGATLVQDDIYWALLRFLAKNVSHSAKLALLSRRG